MKVLLGPRHLEKDYDVEYSVPTYLETIYRLSRLFGLAPVYFEKQQNCCKMKVSPTLSVAFSFIITMLTAISLVGMYFDLTVAPELSSRGGKSTRRLVWVCELFLAMFNSSMIVYGGLRRMKRLIKNHFRMQKIHKLLDDKGGKSDWRKEVSVIWAIILCLFHFLTYYVFMKSVILNGRDLYSAVLYIAYFIGSYPVNFMVVHVACVILEGRNTLKLVNEHFENICRLQDFNLSRHETISHLLFVYDDAFNIIRDLDETFGLDLLIILYSAFIEVVMTSYNLIINLGQAVNIPLLMLQLFFTIYYTLQIVAAVESCHRTLQEVDRAKRLVSKLIINKTDDRYNEELRKLIRFLRLNRVLFSPLGVCTISRPLMAKMAGSMTTYLVILLQYRGQDKGEF